MSADRWHAPLHPPPPPREPPPPVCRLCGESLEGRTAAARFCSELCKLKAWKLRELLAARATPDWSLAHHLAHGEGEAIVRTLRNAGLHHGRGENDDGRAATRPPQDLRGTEGASEG